MNHIPIGEYRLRSFPKEFITCSCSIYPIKTRRYILFECLKYKKSWNLKRESLKDILTFLEFNPRAFCVRHAKLGHWFLYLISFSFSFFLFSFYFLYVDLGLGLE